MYRDLRRSASGWADNNMHNDRSTQAQLYRLRAHTCLIGQTAYAKQSGEETILRILPANSPCFRDRLLSFYHPLVHSNESVQTQTILRNVAGTYLNPNKKGRSTKDRGSWYSYGL